METRSADATSQPAESPASTEPIFREVRIMEAFVRGGSISEEIKNAWKRVKEVALYKETVEDKTRVPHASDDIKEIKAQVQDLKNLVRGLASQAKLHTGPLSYAEVLRGKGAEAIRVGGAQERTLRVPARRARELVVAPGGESAAQRQRTSNEIVRDVNSALEEEGAVIAARRLPSGDVLITFQGEEGKKKWEKDHKGLTAFGENARYRTREFTVLVHGIRVAAVNPANQDKAIAEIYAQNPKLKEAVKIVRLGWSKKTIKSQKRYAALHVGVAEPEQANRLIDSGLLYGSELHDCELFDGTCIVTQCF